ncbi:MAG: methyltransferase domain-containing protein [Betaproteobacteria bacterium]|nr:methyltransferase domain-containing protein [Betaproteobacteria bacterium]
MSNSSGCCPPSQNATDQVRQLYTDLAQHPEKDFGWGKGKENARLLGYDPAWLNGLPDEVWASAAAVGNPFSLGQIGPGETVVDLGCGAGADLCIAALLVGASGRVIGIDVTPAMVDRARKSAALLGARHVEVHEADMAQLPVDDGSVDVVIANGSINLSARKESVLKEIFRVLRPGGRLQFADMVRDGTVQETDQIDGDSWAGCVAGTLAPERLLDLLRKTGFEGAEVVSFTGYRTAATTIGALIRARKP